MQIKLACSIVLKHALVWVENLRPLEHHLLMIYPNYLPLHPLNEMHADGPFPVKIIVHRLTKQSTCLINPHEHRLWILAVPKSIDKLLIRRESYHLYAILQVINLEVPCDLAQALIYHIQICSLQFV